MDIFPRLNRWLGLLALAALLGACFGAETPSWVQEYSAPTPPPDTITPTDTAEPIDVPTLTDAPDEEDVPALTDAPDVPTLTDAPDVEDVPTLTDAPDVPPTPDTCDEGDLVCICQQSGECAPHEICNEAGKCEDLIHVIQTSQPSIQCSPEGESGTSIYVHYPTLRGVVTVAPWLDLAGYVVATISADPNSPNSAILLVLNGYGLGDAEWEVGDLIAFGAQHQEYKCQSELWLDGANPEQPDPPPVVVEQELKVLPPQITIEWLIDDLEIYEGMLVELQPSEPGSMIIAQGVQILEVEAGGDTQSHLQTDLCPECDVPIVIDPWIDENLLLWVDPITKLVGVVHQEGNQYRIAPRSQDDIIFCELDCADVNACGDDGCGGSCGTCEGDIPCQEGVCCVPNCAAENACGGDGCGGDCGDCEAGAQCNGSPGQCEPSTCACLGGDCGAEDGGCPGGSACVYAVASDCAQFDASCDDATGACGVWSYAAGGNGHAYELVTGDGGGCSFIWTSAESAAVEAGGHLATLTSPEEQGFVNTTFSPHTTSEDWNYFGPWLGGKQLGAGPDAPGSEAKDWTWVTGEPWDTGSAAWDTLVGEPNDDDSGGEECLCFSSESAALWNDISCNTCQDWYLLERGAEQEGCTQTISSLTCQPEWTDGSPEGASCATSTDCAAPLQCVEGVCTEVCIGQAGCDQACPTGFDYVDEGLSMGVCKDACGGACEAWEPCNTESGQCEPLACDCLGGGCTSDDGGCPGEATCTYDVTYIGNEGCAQFDATCDGSEGACDVWSYADGGNGHAYALVTPSNCMGWSDAKDDAETYGGTLATLTSLEEMAFVSATFEGETDNGYWNNYGPWLGGFQEGEGQDLHTEWAAHWTWVTGEFWDAEIAAWNVAQNEPNDASDGGEDCLNFAQQSSSLWNDLSCSHCVAQYILELPSADEDCLQPAGVLECEPGSQGATPEGDTCDASADCAAPLQCIDSTCRAVCLGAGPCAEDCPLGFDYVDAGMFVGVCSDSQIQQIQSSPASVDCEINDNIKHEPYTDVLGVVTMAPFQLHVSACTTDDDCDGDDTCQGGTCYSDDEPIEDLYVMSLSDGTGDPHSTIGIAIEGELPEGVSEGATVRVTGVHWEMGCLTVLMASSEDVVVETGDSPLLTAPGPIVLSSVDVLEDPAEVEGLEWSHVTLATTLSLENVEAQAPPENGHPDAYWTADVVGYDFTVAPWLGGDIPIPSEGATYSSMTGVILSDNDGVTLNPMTPDDLVCVPDCAGVTCGGDGCGGVCLPGCEDGAACLEAFTSPICSASCELFQETCQPEQRCVMTEAHGPRCIDANLGGSEPLHAACETPADCMAPYHCLGGFCVEACAVQVLDSGTAANACQTLCDDTWADQPRPYMVYEEALNLGICVTQIVPGVGCDLADWNECAGGQTCTSMYPLPMNTGLVDAMALATGCTDAGAVPVDEACGQMSDCEVDTLCFHGLCRDPCVTDETENSGYTCTGTCAHNRTRILVSPYTWGVALCGDCVPDCDGHKECGSDGCGGSCGSCADACTAGMCTTCDGGTCAPMNRCDEFVSQMNDQPSTLKSLLADAVSMSSTCGHLEGEPRDLCVSYKLHKHWTALSYVSEAPFTLSCSDCWGLVGQCAYPGDPDTGDNEGNCSDACSDPASSTCTTCIATNCPEFETCSGIDPTTLCFPSCPGGSCGDDGCGGSCGACLPGEECEGGVCIAPCAGSFVVHDQASLDAISQCSTLSGDLTIQGAALTSVVGLENLTRVTGDLHITDSDLYGLQGLDNLEEVEGNFFIERATWLTHLAGLASLEAVGGELKLDECNNLQHLAGLQPLQTAGHLTITGNTNLGKLDGLSGLGNVWGHVRIKNNLTLHTVQGQSDEGLANLAYISGILEIDSCPSLQVLDGPTNLAEMGGDLVITSNTGLGSLEGLSNLYQLYGAVIIEANGQLTDLRGLETLYAVTSNFRVASNPLLTSLAGLEGLKVVEGILKITDNNTLASLDDAPQLDTLGNIHIHDNDALCDQAAWDYINGPCGLGCASASAQVYDNHGVAQCDGKACGSDGCGGTCGTCGADETCNTGSCKWNCEGDRTLVTGADLDAISHCTAITGSLTVTGDTLTNLEGLETLEEVNELHITGALVMESLQGLDSLHTVHGHMKVVNNPLLTSIGGLADLTHVGGELRIETCPGLTTLSGLDGLQVIQGGLQLHLNVALTNLDALAALVTMSNDSAIVDNAVLESVSGLGGVTSTSGNFRLKGNKQLQSLDGLNMETVVGDFIIESNDALKDLQGLHNLGSVGASLTIGSNVQLESLTGLSGLTTIDGSLQVFDNHALVSLGGLSALQAVVGEVYIVGNAALCQYLVDAFVESTCPCASSYVESNKDDCVPNTCEQADAAVITTVPFQGSALVGGGVHSDELYAEAGPCADQWSYWEGSTVPPRWPEALWTFEAPADGDYRVTLTAKAADGENWLPPEGEVTMLLALDGDLTDSSETNATVTVPAGTATWMTEDPAMGSGNIHLDYSAYMNAPTPAGLLDGEFTIEWFAKGDHIPVGVNHNGLLEGDLNFMISYSSTGWDGTGRMLYVQIGGVSGAQDPGNGLWPLGWGGIFAKSGVGAGDGEGGPDLEWEHAAVVRYFVNGEDASEGMKMKVFINGVENTDDSYGTGLTTYGDLSAPSTTAPPATMHIGALKHRDDQHWHGQIDGLRITQGVARYTSNFTVPTDYQASGGAPIDNFTPAFWFVRETDSQGCAAALADGACLGVAQASGAAGQAVRTLSLQAGERAQIVATFPADASGLLDVAIEACPMEGCASLGEVCGDGVQDPAEACDDGNRLDGDLCSADCATRLLELPETPPMGVVTDTTHELMWARCSQVQAGTADWQNGWSTMAQTCSHSLDTFTYCQFNSDACNGGEPSGTLDGNSGSALFNACDAMNDDGGFGGLTGWRVPTVEELRSVVFCSGIQSPDQGWPCHIADNSPLMLPTIDPAVFPNTKPGAYWTASAAANSLDAYTVSFSGTPQVEELSKKNVGHYVRCVRDLDGCSTQCEGVTCGDDACGGSCGVCGPWEVCEDGGCEFICGGSYTVSDPETLAAMAHCEIWDGDLAIIGGVIESLVGLENLEEVVGSLLISFTALPNLAGLESLRIVGGDLQIGPDFSIMSIAQLHLTEVLGDIHIQQVTKLPNLTGFDGLTAVQGDLHLDNNGLLKVSGLDSVTAIAGSLTIKNHDELFLLDGLSELTSIGQNLTISNNDSLKALTGLSGLSAMSPSAHVTFSNNGQLCATEAEAFLEIVCGDVNSCEQPTNTFNLTCADNEQCLEGVCSCAPACDGKECGGDGCGGTCGTCADSDFCSDSQCVTAYLDNDDGTVSAAMHELMWMQCSMPEGNGGASWAAMVTAVNGGDTPGTCPTAGGYKYCGYGENNCNGLNTTGVNDGTGELDYASYDDDAYSACKKASDQSFAGHDNWRVPTADELRSLSGDVSLWNATGAALLDLWTIQETGLGLGGDAPDAPVYWSSTSFSTDLAIAVDVVSSAETTPGKSNRRLIRCVREDCTDGPLPCQLAVPLRDCAEIHAQYPTWPDGLYAISPDGGDPIEAYCDMTTDGGGWTLALMAFATGLAGDKAPFSPDALVPDGVAISPTMDASFKLTDAHIALITSAEVPYRTVANGTYHPGTRYWQHAVGANSCHGNVSGSFEAFVCGPLSFADGAPPASLKSCNDLEVTDCTTYSHGLPTGGILNDYINPVAPGQKPDAENLALYRISDSGHQWWLADGHDQATRCLSTDAGCDFALWVKRPTCDEEATYYLDTDGDGIGTYLTTLTACAAPYGYVETPGDCDDHNPTKLGAVTYYEDSDSDGYGNSDASQLACEVPTGYVALAGDCDDADHMVNPDANNWMATTTLAGTWDWNCDGVVEQEWTSLGACDGGSAAPQGWWLTGVPACGETATWLQDCDETFNIDEGFVTEHDTEQRQQKCR